MRWLCTDFLPISDKINQLAALLLTGRFRASGRYPRLKNGLEFFLFSPVESEVGSPPARSRWIVSSKLKVQQ
jgi:hypothetical protein